MFFALLGIGFAFVPVEERPMDVWVMSFFKSIYNPTQYVWSRRPKQKPAAQAHHVATKPPVTPKEPTPRSPADMFSGLRILTMNPPGGFLVWLKNLFTFKPKTQPLAQPAFTLPPTVVGKRPQPEVTPQPEIKEVVSPAPDEKSAVLSQKVEELETELTQKNVSDSRVLELQKQLTDLLSDKRKLEEEVVALRRKTTSAPTQSQPTKTATVISEEKPTEPTIKIIDPSAAAKAGLPRLTTYPNVVTGIVKDTAGNFLPSVLVTVRDKEGVPLRALKTNRLGQFAASTALSPGTYLVEVEDPRERYVFDRAQIVVNNAVLPTIEILAKSQKELERQKLAQQIFGNTQ